jgi:uncharacterized protein Usg|tara:strand:- start:8946 stop:9182 length:237 start_codon:yes stop_codon:yes gene_type:complete
MIIKKDVTVQIYYWMPDYQDILQEFVWQTRDIVPEYPRIHKFLNFWHKEIDAVINEVIVAHSDKRNYRSVDWLHNLGH